MFVRRSTLVAFALAPLSALAQFHLAWVNVVDGGMSLNDGVANMAVDAAGNTYVVGTVNSYGPDTYADIAVAKYAPSGTVVWYRTYDGPANSQDVGFGIALGGDGSVNVVGRVLTPNASSDFVTLKYRAADGSLLWSRTYDGPAHSVDQGMDVAADAAGNVVVTGEVWNDAEFYSNGDFCTIKYDASGTLVWAKLYDGPATYIAISDQPQNVRIDMNGDVIVSGDSPGTSNIDDIVTLKYRGTDGALVWEQRYTGLGANDNNVGLQVASNNDVIVTGNTFQNDYKIVVIRYDGQTGAEDWATVDVFPHHGQLARPGSMALDPQDNPVVSLTYDPDFDESNMNYNIQTTKYNFADGSRSWSMSYGNLARYDAQGARAVAVDRQGNVAVAGTNLVVPHTRLAFWVYRGSDGALLWNSDVALSKDSDSPVRVLFDRSGNVVAAGRTTNNNTGIADFFVAKYAKDGVPQPVGNVIGN